MAKPANVARVRLLPEREIEIADLADGVVEVHCSEKRIDPDAIIRAKDIALFYDHYENAFDGMLEYDTGRFYIHCNIDRENTPGSARARFTLAHELGHYFIDEHRNSLASGQVKPHPSFSDRGTANLLVEREADFFASRLLLPDSRFRARVKRLPAGLSGIAAVAEEFEVSLTCAAIRFVTTEVFPCVLIKWSDDGFGWKWCSRGFWNLGYRKTIESHSRVPAGSATAECLAKGGGFHGIVEKGTTAAYWFPFVVKKNVRNVILKEEAVTLGRFGVITLLSLHQGKFPREVSVARAHELGLEDDLYRTHQ